MRNNNIAIFIISIGFYSTNLSAQEPYHFNHELFTKYVKAENSTFCGEGEFSWIFTRKNILFRTGKDERKQQIAAEPSIEFFSDELGVYIYLFSGEYIDKIVEPGHRYRWKHNYYVCYDRKGGNLVYIMELGKNNRVVSNYYYTQLGYELYCN